MKPNELGKEEEASRQIINALNRVSSPAQAPRDFLTTVMASIDQMPPPRRRFLDALMRWTTWQASPMTQATVAAVLALSLALNIWLGFSVREKREPQSVIAWRTNVTPGSREMPSRGSPELPERAQAPDGGGGDAYFSSAQYQLGIRSATDVGLLAQADLAPGAQALTLGFAGQSEETRFFLLGSRYAAAVAYLRSDKLDMAAKRESLEAVARAVRAVQAPGALDQYIRHLQYALTSPHYSPEVLYDVLALFQPLCEDYARSKGQELLVLFRAGAWLIDLRLTVAAQDTALLRQPAQARYFRDEMQRLNAPRGVLDALEQITHMMEKPKLTDADVTEILRLVQQIQTIFA